MNSSGRILTTHVGSLPRPDDPVEIMFAREDGIPIDEAVRHEHEAIIDAGILLRVEALNRALVNIPPGEARMRPCWGNYPGPRHCDLPLEDIVDVVWRARPQGSYPRRNRVAVELHRASGPRRAADPALR